MKPTESMAAQLIYLVLGLFLSATLAHAASVVEFTLVDKLDEPSGFCLDIVGSQQKADLTRGLQAHTCYSYQKKIAVDQGFDGDRLKNGEFRLPWFKVCVALTDAQPGSTLALMDCDGSVQQRFDFTASGQIVIGSNSALCLTVKDGASIPGAGGKPTHLIRRLWVERCTSSLDIYQKWRIREKAD